jgi:hypothetical protein
MGRRTLLGQQKAEGNRPERGEISPLAPGSCGFVRGVTGAVGGDAREGRRQ